MTPPDGPDRSVDSLPQQEQQAAARIPAVFRVPSVDETLGSALAFSRAAYRLTTAQASRLYAIVRLLDRADAAINDIAELRRSAQCMAENLAELTRSATGLNDGAAEIAREINGLTNAARGIDENAEQAPMSEGIEFVVNRLCRLRGEPARSGEICG